MLNIKISTKGNLQWIKELLENNGNPAHGIWNLNTSIYVTGLNRKIKGKKTDKLKSSLIHATQKIELIGNYLSTHRQAKERELEKHAQAIAKVLIKPVGELINLVDTIKKYLIEEFKIKVK